MPNLRLEGLDKSALRADLRQQYLSQLRNDQMIYYYLMLSLGSVLFLVGALI